MCKYFPIVCHPERSEGSLAKRKKFFAPVALTPKAGNAMTDEMEYLNN